ncbi:unnamed protein product, partial [marine sediment metagenome]
CAGNAFGEVTLTKQLIEPDDILLEELEVTPSVPAKRNVAYLSVALELLKPKINQTMSDETLRERASGLSFIFSEKF